MPTCATSVTTPTGVFTYFDKEVTVCQAKIECAKLGQILAPVSNVEDFKALLSVADIRNPECKFHYGTFEYHIGLDIDMCGSEQTRLFSNNIVWDQAQHGDLYKEEGSKTEDTNYADFFPYPNIEHMFIVRDPKMNDKLRYICLKPNSTSSNAAPIYGKEVVYHPNYNMLYVCGSLMMAVLVCVVFIVKVRRESHEVRNKNINLENEIECLKKKIELSYANFQ